MLYETTQEYHNNRLKIEMIGYTKKLVTPFEADSKEGPLKCTENRELYRRSLKNYERVNNTKFNGFKISLVLKFIINVLQNFII